MIKLLKAVITESIARRFRNMVEVLENSVDDYFRVDLL